MVFGAKINREINGTEERTQKHMKPYINTQFMTKVNLKYNKRMVFSINDAE